MEEEIVEVEKIEEEEEMKSKGKIYTYTNQLGYLSISHYAYKIYTNVHLPYPLNQMPLSISSCSRTVAALPLVLNEINAALE